MSEDKKIIDIARQVIDDEVEALVGLKDYIDENFEKIIDVIYECKGRLIFTGIGKSGHISKKISATLSSTGTSSFFMHSTEAFHGDLGMIQSDDIVVAISYSGETEDLLKTIPIIKEQVGNKKVLLEQFTTEPCQFCPDGKAEVEAVISQYPYVIAIAHRAGFSTDFLTTSFHSAFNGITIPSLTFSMTATSIEIFGHLLKSFLFLLRLHLEL